MIAGPDGARLHKRHGSISVAQFRDQGIVPEALVNYLALLGWSHPGGGEILSLDEMTRAFSLERVSRSAAAFDAVKLAFLNAHHIRTMPAGRLFALALPFLRAAGRAGGELGDEEASWWASALAIVSGQMQTLGDAPGAMAFLFEPGGAPPLAEGEADLLAAFEDLASRESLAISGVFRGCAVAAGKATGKKGRDLFHPLRLALTGREKGPELDRIVPLIEEGSRLGISPRVPRCVERVRSRLAGIDRSGGAAGQRPESKGGRA
jgi:glutamyl/glutaminyl-tRNA synthetase